MAGRLGAHEVPVCGKVLAQSDELQRRRPEDGRHAGKDPQTVEILANKTQIVAELDPRDPYSDHVTCILTPHPTFADWQTVLDKELTQSALHAFLRGHKTDMPDPLAQQMLIAEVGKLSVSMTRDVDHHINEKGYIEFSGNTGKNVVKGSMPSDFALRVPLIMGVMAEGSDNDERTYTFDVLVTLGLTERGASFRLTAPGLAVAQHEARMDAIAYLTRLLGSDSGFLVGLGDYATQTVPVVLA